MLVDPIRLQRWVRRLHVASLGISVRSQQRLTSLGLVNVGDLLSADPAQLASQLPPPVAEEVRAALRHAGLHPSPSPSNTPL